MKYKERVLDLIINDHPEIHFQSYGAEGRTQGPEYMVYEELEDVIGEEFVAVWP